jgi:hypothetical protein
VLASVSRGKKLITLLAEGHSGLISNAQPTFKSNKHTGDYSEMNSENYVCWPEKKLITTLEPNSVLMMDNASYSNIQKNKVPTSNSSKEIMQNWLHGRNTHFLQHDAKSTAL